MKVFTLKRSQFLPVDITTAWEFLSNPENLGEITPDNLRFEIISDLPKTMFEGMIIQYKIRPMFNFPVQWVSEITHFKPPFYFVDEQRIGPYKLWHHQHILEETLDGVVMKDEVNYALPFGILGQLAHAGFIKEQLNRIFEYRFNVLNKYFKNIENPCIT